MPKNATIRRRCIFDREIYKKRKIRECVECRTRIDRKHGGLLIQPFIGEFRSRLVLLSSFVSSRGKQIEEVRFIRVTYLIAPRHLSRMSAIESLAKLDRKSNASTSFARPFHRLFIPRQSPDTINLRNSFPRSSDDLVSFSARGSSS